MTKGFWRLLLSLVLLALLFVSFENLTSATRVAESGKTRLMSFRFLGESQERENALQPTKSTRSELSAEEKVDRFLEIPEGEVAFAQLSKKLLSEIFSSEELESSDVRSRVVVQKKFKEALISYFESGHHVTKSLEEVVWSDSDFSFEYSSEIGAKDLLLSGVCQELPDDTRRLKLRSIHTKLFEDSLTGRRTESSFEMIARVPLGAVFVVRMGEDIDDVFAVMMGD